MGVWTPGSLSECSECDRTGLPESAETGLPVCPEHGHIGQCGNCNEQTPVDITLPISAIDLCDDCAESMERDRERQRRADAEDDEGPNYCRHDWYGREDHT